MRYFIKIECNSREDALRVKKVLHHLHISNDEWDGPNPIKAPPIYIETGDLVELDKD